MTVGELSTGDEHARPRILCVDDEPRVLEALERNLRNRFVIVTAVGSMAALAELERDPTFAVIMSDLRMPGMDGVSLLARAHALAPDAVRVLLTGDADLEAAIEAVNHGRVYQFLRKPCHPQVMVRALQLAAEQHSLITAEREVLEQTLRGSIRALADVLALMSPAAFGRSERVQRMAGRMARQLALPDPWSIEVAAIIWHLGCLAISPSLADRIGSGAELEPVELALVAQLPDTALRLIAHIPRLDAVRDLLKSVAASPPATVTPGAQVLRAALEIDTLEARGLHGGEAWQLLEVMLAGCDHRVMEILSENLRDTRTAAEASEVRMREMRLSEVTLGMQFAGDVINQAGLLLVARGQEVTTPLLERVRTYWCGFAHTAMVQMILPPSTKSDSEGAADQRGSVEQVDHLPTATASEIDPVRSGSPAGNAEGSTVLSTERSTLADLLAQ